MFSNLLYKDNLECLDPSASIFRALGSQACVTMPTHNFLLQKSWWEGEDKFFVVYFSRQDSLWSPDCHETYSVNQAVLEFT